MTCGSQGCRPERVAVADWGSPAWRSSYASTNLVVMVVPVVMVVSIGVLMVVIVPMVIGL